MPGTSGKAIIYGRQILIAVDIDVLPAVVEGAWAAGALQVRYKITDADAFARYVVAELNRESESGTTAIHRLFDRSFEEAIDQGAEGVERHEDQSM